DRVIVRADIKSRLADSLETALKIADGLAIAELADKPLPHFRPSSSGGPAPSPSQRSSSGEPFGSNRGPRKKQVEELPLDPRVKPEDDDGEGSAVAGNRSAVNKSKNETHERLLFSEKFACPVSGFTISEIEPRLFSFNNPFGACPECDGLGTKQAIDPELIVPDEAMTLKAGAIAPWSKTSSPY